MKSLLKMNGADYLAGTATVIGPNKVRVTNADGGVEEIEAKKAIVLATGSTTVELPAFKFDGKQIIGAREAVSPSRRPCASAAHSSPSPCS